MKDLGDIGTVKKDVVEAMAQATVIITSIYRIK